LVRRVVTEKDVSTSEAYKALKQRREENLDQFQRRTLEYATKFSPLKDEGGERLLERLISETGIPRKEAIMIVNILPRRPEELVALFSATMKRLITRSDAEKIIAIVEDALKEGQKQAE